MVFLVYYKDQNLNISRTFLNFLILASLEPIFESGIYMPTVNV